MNVFNLYLEEDSMREMKESGFEWIEKIPEDWKIKNLKNVFNFKKGLSITKDNLIEQGQPVISYGQIHANFNKGTYIDERLIRYVSKDYLRFNSACLTKHGDFIFADTSEDLAGCGNAVYNDTSEKIFAGYHTIILSNSDFDNKYFAYLFQTDVWRSQIRERVFGVKLFSITQKILKECKVIIPSEEERLKISNFLDTKCSEIDLLMKDIKQQISQLEEYKKSVITKTVTKGLVPGIGLKDSGIEWIGKIPKTWSVNGLKYVFNFKKGLSITKDNLIDNGQPVISYGQIHAKYNTGTSIDERLVRYVSDDYLKFNYNCLTRHGDFIFADTSEDLIGCGNAVYNDTLDEIFAGYHTIILSNNDFDNKYFAYLFQTDLWRSQIRKKVFGVKLFSITQKILKECSIIIPPKEERLLISNYLDDKCNTIDSIIESKQQQLSKLEEYKKSMIYEYVTGKKEVL